MRSPTRVYRSLADPILVKGVEPKFLMFNVGMLLFFITMFKLLGFAFFPVTYILHKVLQQMGKADPFMRGVYLVYMKQADRYEPWPEESPKRAKRPTNIGWKVVG